MRAVIEEVSERALDRRSDDCRVNGTLEVLWRCSDTCPAISLLGLRLPAQSCRASVLLGWFQFCTIVGERKWLLVPRQRF